MHYAKDLAGNEVIERTKFTVDTTLPALADMTPAPGQFARYYSWYPASVSVNVSDMLSGVDLSSAVLIVDGEAVSHGFSFWTPGVITVGVSLPLSEGTHTAQVKVKDLAGNVAETSWSFLLDGTAPVIENVFPAQGSVLTALPSEFTATISDVPSVLCKYMLHPVFFYEGVEF